MDEFLSVEAIPKKALIKVYLGHNVLKNFKIKKILLID
jgi:hypothetical protein